MLIAEEDLSPDEMLEMEFSQFKTRESMLSKLDLGAARRAQQLSELLGSFLASQRKVELSPGLRGKKSIFNEDAWKYSKEDTHAESSLDMVMPRSSFLEKVETCESLACLREAHALREEGEKSITTFNFPHAIVLGWQKSATTSLYQHLSGHPTVLASVEKEPEFFTRKCKGNPFSGCGSEDEKDYIREILQRDRYIESGGRLMAFEASTHYAMNGDVLAAGMARAMPWVKVVASLREPISRAASMLVHMYDTEGAGCLAEHGKKSLYYCLTTASQLTGHPGPYNNLDSPHGNYSTALEAWIKHFDSNHLHIIEYESLIEQESDSSSKSLQKLKSFLNLDSSLPDNRLRLHNSRKELINPEGWPMKVEEYQDLISRVSPDVERCVCIC